MTIRRLLLVAFIALTFLASALLAGLSFFAARKALASEIERNLSKDAAMLMEQVDELLFERLQNIHSWSHLDIMQEARVGDVDKRLARFLSEIRLGYGAMYKELFYTDRSGRILASTDPAAIGRHFEAQPVWAETTVPGGEVFLESLQLEPPYTSATLMIRAPVHDLYGGDNIGQLYGAFDFVEVFRQFDQTESSTGGERRVALLDRQGRLIAASRSLRRPDLLMSDAFASWNGGAVGIIERPGAPAFSGTVLAGQSSSAGYQGYPGLGWSLLVMQPVEQAFRPIRNLLGLFFFAFLATALVASVAAHGIAGRIARPLVGLTTWVRGFMRTESKVEPVVAGAREVRELGAAFQQMMASLEHSRRQVIDAAKLAVVGEMAAIMAHEVRTPLGILHTSAQMLRREEGLSPEGQDMTRIVLEESSRLGRLITTLLECARPRAPNMRESNVHGILERAAELLAVQARKKDIRLEWRLEAANPSIACDAELLMQVFLNLMLNAVQILHAGSTLLLATASDKDGLTVDVEDNGPGILLENRGRVFDPFYTTREGGIGLGLTVSRQIAAAHGGDIEVGASRLGGACFRVRLPRTQAPRLPGSGGAIASGQD
ncbi:sensor histidine kinase [Methyloterricola oryzae]|uniref:sensor histidine kinase n=1 Tax=Methyloterricola oryzae TaxID=1495050 RepID=UPI0005EBE195|nr:PAS domain-containing sensor histidine kinase [Methyloterricola oryzae]